MGGVTTGYTWNAEGELTATGGTTFVYDADGNRIVRTDTSGTTVYVGGQEVHISSTWTVKATRYQKTSTSNLCVPTVLLFASGAANRTSLFGPRGFSCRADRRVRLDGLCDSTDLRECHCRRRVPCIH